MIVCVYIYIYTHIDIHIHIHIHIHMNNDIHIHSIHMYVCVGLRAHIITSEIHVMYLITYTKEMWGFDSANSTKPLLHNH